MKRYLTFILFFLLSFSYIHAGNSESLPEAHPRQDEVNRVKVIELGDNPKLESLVDILKQMQADPSVRITMLEVKALMSPEKGKTESERLSLEKINEVIQYIKTHITISDDLICHSGGIAWTELRHLVSASNMQYRNDVMYILDSVPEDTRIKNKLIDSRNKQLMDLEGGRPYLYMREHFFPKLVSASVVISYHQESTPVVVRRMKKVSSKPIRSSSNSKHLLDNFALRTNLLYFGLLAPNIGVEYHFTSNNLNTWSLGLSFTMPWWSNKKSHKYYRLPFLELDAKYYLGKTKRHNVGLYAQGGKYELKFRDVGSIGGFGGIGVSYGYLQPIGKNLSLNFEIGLGYIYSRNIQYSFSEQVNDYYYIRSVKQHLFLPTKTGVTLVWKMGDFFTKIRKK